MSITLVAVVIALVLGHVAPAMVTGARHYAWYGSWMRWIGTQSGDTGFWRGRYGIALALLPPLLLLPPRRRRPYGPPVHVKKRLGPRRKPPVELAKPPFGPPVGGRQCPACGKWFADGHFLAWNGERRKKCGPCSQRPAG